MTQTCFLKILYLFIGTCLKKDKDYSIQHWEHQSYIVEDHLREEPYIPKRTGPKMSSCLFKLCPVTDLLIRPAGSLSILILSDGTSPAATYIC